MSLLKAGINKDVYFRLLTVFDVDFLPNGSVVKPIPRQISKISLRTRTPVKLDKQGFVSCCGVTL